MKYKFDEIIDRSRTNSFKWKARELKNNGHEMYPMWVADMEFDASPAIQKRLADRVKEGVFGYELLSEDYYKAVQYWLKKRHVHTPQSYDRSFHMLEHSSLLHPALLYIPEG